MPTDLEPATQYILKIVRYLCKIVCRSDRCGSRKNWPGLCLWLSSKNKVRKHWNCWWIFRWWGSIVLLRTNKNSSYHSTKITLNLFQTKILTLISIAPYSWYGWFRNMRGFRMQDVWRPNFCVKTRNIFCLRTQYHYIKGYRKTENPVVSIMQLLVTICNDCSDSC